MTFNFAQWVGGTYWEKRGVHVPCHPREELLSRSEDDTMQQRYGGTLMSPAVDMVALVASCTVVVSTYSEAIRRDRDLDWLYCKEVVHELGHIAGLGHDYGGVMSPAQNVVPWGCDHPIKFRRSQRR